MQTVMMKASLEGRRDCASKISQLLCGAQLLSRKSFAVRTIRDESVLAASTHGDPPKKRPVHLSKFVLRRGPPIAFSSEV
jgi:hypothetical protein